MRHIGPGDAVHTRQARQRRCRKFRKARVVAARYAFANLLELRFDEVKVVQQPFGRRRDVAPALRNQRDVVEGAAKRCKVLVDPGKEGRRITARIATLHDLRACKAVAVLLETL